MKVVISGCAGTIGGALCPTLCGNGASVVGLSRNPRHQRVRPLGCRVVLLRNGIVLTPTGGALAQLLSC